MAMREFSNVLSPRDQGWLDLRERLARAAREMHFSATSLETGHGAALLMISGNLATLAMSIPMPSCPAAAERAPTALVEPYTLLAVQLLQQRPDWSRDDNGRRQLAGPANA
jgi:hypothetical protein